MKYLNKIIPIILIAFTVNSLGAQVSFKQYFEKGAEELDKDNFSAALVYFAEAHDKDETNQDALYFYGESALNQLAYKQAEYAFQKLVDETDNAQYPDASFKLAKIKNMLGNYEEAKHYYDLYLSENFGDNERMTNEAILGKESAEWASKQNINEVDYLKATTIEGDINSPYSEHAALWRNDQLEFSSLRFPKKKDKAKRLVSKIMLTGNETESARKNRFYNSDEYLTSNSSYTPDGKTHFFTICDYGEGGLISCDIYYRVLHPDGSWGIENKLPQIINLTTSTNTQVAVGSKDGNYQQLYFVSDREGGKGGLDIWKTKFDTKMDFQAPINVTEINTEFDDITPFYSVLDDKLFFSSNGRNGFGGFDVYEINGSKIENLGKEVNTSFNEIYYSTAGGEAKAFFSSNRPGSQYLMDKFETCCYDIYETGVERCIQDLMALTFEKESRKPLTEVAINIVDSKGKTHSFKTNEANQYDFDLPCDDIMKLEVTKEGYMPVSIDLKNLKEGHKELVYLEKSPLDLKLFVFDKKEQNELFETRLKFYEKNKSNKVNKSSNQSNEYTLSVVPGKTYVAEVSKNGFVTGREEINIPLGLTTNFNSDVFLTKADLELRVTTFERATKSKISGVEIVVTDVNNNPVDRKVVDIYGKTSMLLVPGSEYLIKARKNGYDEELKRIMIPADKTGRVSEDLYLGRVAEIASLNNLIPLKLYFNNDSPDRSTMNTSTEKIYSETYDPYYDQKNKFREVYSGKFGGEKRFVAQNEIETFFEDDLRGGYERLTIFMETLNRILVSGKKVNLYLRGYASPVAQSEYNAALGKRRVDCVRNEFEIYQGGIFLSYINSGQLAITERSFGELESTGNVSDDPNSPESSIFSPRASKERRIEIDEIKEVN